MAHLDTCYKETPVTSATFWNLDESKIMHLAGRTQRLTARCCCYCVCVCVCVSRRQHLIGDDCEINSNFRQKISANSEIIMSVQHGQVQAVSHRRSHRRLSHRLMKRSQKSREAYVRVAELLCGRHHSKWSLKSLQCYRIMSVWFGEPTVQEHTWRKKTPNN